ncbi:hypothetical protein K402DRAFT_419033 [Aulographum hederae CBS 113979]|uniref:Uncharacterized protein n=1 Tax=Aulographum hederae CBS 113979 TaxID=1176131 RepID=A0A6G1H837_9PEZI|nr:hypothetical protein K402DRAFT_419033 [Aulographum hederae CBS 113979]
MKSLALLLSVLQATSGFPHGPGETTSSSPAIAPNASTTLNSPVPEGVFLEKHLSMQDTPKTPGAKMIKTRTGPFNLKSMEMVSSTPRLRVDMPCTDCYLTAMEAGLELEDGTSVNIDSGAWLHHMVLYIMGPGHSDLTCPLNWPERIYAAGNERTTARLNEKEPLGIKVGKSDRLAMIYDLVNNAMEDRTFYVTMMFEYVPSTSPEFAAHKPAKCLWLDITNCGDSEEVAPPTPTFTLESQPYSMARGGRFINGYGHVHDAGQKVSITVNNDIVCDSAQLYGREAGFIESREGENPGMAHVSDAGTCREYGGWKAGDKLSVKTFYDSRTTPLNKMHDGSVQEVMGIAINYVVEE